jgi:uncharacterized membrane protein YhhN
LPYLPSDLQIPVLGYTVFLGFMACLSSGVSARLGLGGFLFMFSDTMIGVSIAKFPVPFLPEIIIVTYLIAQYLIITEWSNKHVEALRRGAAQDSKAKK